ncbi:MAG TPA: WD40 repeat domain-containing protein [Gemmataceae bacterium]|nr:WD40 repeat domain-containing protein [Gemmataceae bacterium]
MVDPAKCKSRVAYNVPGTFYALAADGAHGRLYAGGDDYAIHVFDLSNHKNEVSLPWKQHDSYVSGLVFLPQASNPQVVSASYDGRLIWWNPATGKAVRTLAAHATWIRGLALTADRRMLLSAGDDMVVKAWDATSGRLLRTFSGHAQRTPQGHVTALYAVSASPDGKYVAAGDRIGTVCVWELETAKLVQRFEVPVLYTYDPVQRKRSIGGIRALAFSPDGALLAAGGIGQVGNVDGLAGPAHVELWNWRKPQRCCALGAQGHKALVNCLQFHPSHPWLLGAGGGSDNGLLAFWNLAAIAPSMPEKKEIVSGQRIKADGHIHAFRLSAAGDELYAAGYRKLEVWKLS